MPRVNYLCMEKKRRLIFVKFLLACGVILLCYSLGLTFSRFRSTGSVRPSFGIAKWDVSVDNTLSNRNINLVCGGSGENYTFLVSSESEVTAKYSVVLSNVPEDTEVSLDGGSYTTPTNNTISFNDVGFFNVSDAIHERQHTLSFRSPLNATETGTSQINMEVRFSQVI